MPCRLLPTPAPVCIGVIPGGSRRDVSSTRSSWSWCGEDGGAREVMLDSKQRLLSEGENPRDAGKIWLLIFFFACGSLPTQFGHFLGFPVPKDKSHFFVNLLPVHTSQIVNYRFRLLLGFLVRNKCFRLYTFLGPLHRLATIQSFPRVPITF